MLLQKEESFRDWRLLKHSRHSMERYYEFRFYFLGQRKCVCSYMFHNELIRPMGHVLEVNLEQSGLVKNNIILFISHVHFCKYLYSTMICYPACYVRIGNATIVWKLNSW